MFRVRRKSKSERREVNMHLANQNRWNSKTQHIHSQSLTTFLLHCYNSLVSYCLLSYLYLFFWASSCLFHLVSKILSFLVFFLSFLSTCGAFWYVNFVSSLGTFKDLLTRSSSDGVLEKLIKISREREVIFHSTKFSFGKTFF